MVKITPGPVLSGGSSYSTNTVTTADGGAMIKVPASCGAVSIQTYATAAASYSIYISNSDFTDAWADVTTASDDVIWTLLDTFTDAAAGGRFKQYSGVCGAIKIVLSSGTLKLAVVAK